MVLFEKVCLESAISMEIWTKIHANLIENCKQWTNIPKTQAKNSKERQIYLFYLPTLGRISKPGLDRQ